MIEKKPDVTDFAVAPRRKKEGPRIEATETRSSPQDPEFRSDDMRSEQVTEAAPIRSGRKSLPDVPASERQAKAEKRALEQKASRRRLADLKQQNRREAKFPINVHLDYELKARLKEASMKTGVSIQKIAETAIENFLLDEGY
ncbi:hypothetical protein FS815_25585 [Agrobacterium vitis]|uniref:hypothetical protein n=1 Tax=Allorhizobium ampelinum TaxID=3025782 RepID=UPI001F3B8970|nr:hypothetical protein [Allorhizobium ampelinum]MCF1450164.1 hypothetical protein [Allorhizobium ampelinum]